jgi:hypothetical protein
MRAKEKTDATIIMKRFVPILIAAVAGFLFSWLIYQYGSSAQRQAVPYIEKYDLFVIAVAVDEPYTACLEFGESPLFGFGLKGDELALSLKYQSGAKATTIYKTNGNRTKDGASVSETRLYGKNICEDRDAGETFLVSTGALDTGDYNFLAVREGY